MQTRNHYFYIDEAGDDVLFNRKGQIVIGTEGCSKFFILGLLDVNQPDILEMKLQILREELLEDSYFYNVPSMMAKTNKTAIAFHAKDDLPEVRREVFSLLCQQDLRFYAVVQDKQKLADFVRHVNKKLPDLKYRPNNLYDYMVSCLFTDLLDCDEQYHIYFAKRGHKDRTEALLNALFMAKPTRNCEENIQITPDLPRNHGGLQAVDYYLWAVQRSYERSEDRFINLLGASIVSIKNLNEYTTDILKKEKAANLRRY